MVGLEIVSHCVAFIYEIGSRATQFRFCMRSNIRDAIAFYLLEVDMESKIVSTLKIW